MSLSIRMSALTHADGCDGLMRAGLAAARARKVIIVP